MSKAYVPGEDADAIIARQVAKGNFPSADAVVRASVRMIEEYEADLVRLRVKIDAAEAAYQRGEYRESPRTRCNESQHPLQGRRTITPKDLIVTDPAYADLDDISILLLQTASMQRDASCPISSTIFIA